LRLVARAQKDERQGSERQAEPRAIRQRMGGETAERVVPAEIGVTIIRARRHESARCPGQPLHGVVGLSRASRWAR